MRLKLYRGWWYVVWRENGETVRRALRTQDRDAAGRALADLQQSRARPRDTIAEIFPAYLAEKGKPRAEWAWARLKPSFGYLRPDQVTAARCRDYGALRRMEKVGDGTIHTELTFLRAALNWYKPGAGAALVLPAKPPPKNLHMTRDQVLALLAAAKTPHVNIFIRLAIATAGRMGAILDLTWQRVDFDAGIIRLADGPQTKKGRATVPMTDSLRRALEFVRDQATSPYVVEYGGKQVKKIRKAFERAAIEAGLPWVTPHVLRHTAAVWMAEAGTPMAQIAQFLGHTDERTTFRVYARFTPDYLRQAAAALEVD